MTPKETLEKMREVDVEIKDLTVQMRRNRRVLIIFLFVMAAWWSILLVLALSK